MLWIGLICVAVGVYVLCNYCSSRSDEPPYLPGAWPIVGHLPLVFGDTAKLWTLINTYADEIHKLGGVVRFGLGPKTIYFVADPTDMLTVANACLDKAPLYGIANSFLRDGLVISKAPTWKTHRKLLNPAFSQNVLNTFMDIFNSEARNFVNDLKQEVGKGLFDHSDYLKLNSFDTTFQAVIGTEFTNTDLKRKYIEYSHKYLFGLIQRGLKFWLHSDWIFHYSNLKKTQDDCVKVLQSISNSVLEKKKLAATQSVDNICGNEGTSQGTRVKCYMDILLEISQQGMLSDRQVREHADTIINAGTDTTAIALTFILRLLGAHPAVQDRAVAEIIQVSGDKDKDVEKNDLSQLIYLDAVIKESLRLYPVAPVVGRYIDKDVKLRNCTLHAGQSTVLFLLGAHLHPSWGPDRHQFRPERWLDPSQLPENPSAFAAYSVGKRSCIGKLFASMFMKTILTHVLRHYKITADSRPSKVELNIMAAPVSGHLISIEKRKSPLTLLDK